MVIGLLGVLILGSSGGTGLERPYLLRRPAAVIVIAAFSTRDFPLGYSSCGPPIRLRFPSARPSAQPEAPTFSNQSWPWTLSTLLLRTSSFSAAPRQRTRLSRAATSSYLAFVVVPAPPPFFLTRPVGAADKLMAMLDKLARKRETAAAKRHDGNCSTR